MPNDPKNKNRFNARFFAWAIGIMLAGLSVAFCGILFWQQFSIPFRISPETTLYTAPLTEDGQVDFLQAFEQQHRTPDLAKPENGFRLIIQEIGRFEDTPEQVQVAQDLGLSDHSPPAAKFQTLNEFLRQLLQEGKGDSVLEALPELAQEIADEPPEENLWRIKEAIAKRARSWEVDELGFLTPWLENNEQMIPILQQAIDKPVFEIPTSAETYFFDARAITEALTFAIQRELSQQNYGRAIERQLLLRKWADKLYSSRSIGLCLTGIAAHAVANDIGLPIEALNTEQLGKLQESLATEKPAQSMKPIADIIRAEILFTISQMSAGNNMDLYTYYLHEIKTGVDWNLVTKHAIRLTGDRDLSQLSTINDELGDIYCEFSLSDDKVQWANETPLSGIDSLKRGVSSIRVAERIVCRNSGASRSVIEGSRRNLCQIHLKRIALAMLMYQKEHGRLPPAYTTDSKGNRLHSWRVLILPYLGHGSLFQKIRLNEPWDSQHNQAFHKMDLEVYRCPSHPDAMPGDTNYYTSVGYGAALDSSAIIPQSTKIKVTQANDESINKSVEQIPNQILAFEHSQCGNWMSPDVDPTVSEAIENFRWQGSFAPKASFHSSLINVSNTDGSSRAISTTEFYEFVNLLLGLPEDE